ncbi:MAG: zinc metallopeptidase [Saprospirales bacterium]|nr:zinc metallopeptidase [Saprospirales bacterium]MBK8920573.1 zinc metallopeptidase [Saprospirales bacterium]
MGIIVISILFTVIGMILSGTLRGKFNKYSQVPLTNGMSGAEVAATMLRHYGISEVQITQVDGQLTDHYNPLTKTVNLSYDVYHGRNVAAAAVASHECGHAVQHATAYSMLKMRSALVPIVNVAASIQQYIFMFALVSMSMLKNPIVMMVVLVAFGITCLFSLVTLPVEFDASRRALAWLDNSGVARDSQYTGAKDALFWAAMTYVAAALAALLQFVYLLLRFMGSRE